MTLNVLDTFQTQISETIFEGANFSFNNQNLSEQGTFRDTLNAQNGCDSFIVLTLTVLDTFQTQITETICQGETLNFNNQNLSESGIYRDTLAAVTNADSFIVLTLNVLDTFQTQISQPICNGDAFDFNGFSISESGIYRDTLMASNGCDSFIVLTLNILDTFQTQISETIFEGENLPFNNQNLSEQGTFRDTLAAQNGCDSFIVLTITVLDTFQTQITETICQGETLNFNNQNLSESGVYRDTLTAVTMPIVLLFLTLNVLDTFQTQISQPICNGDAFDFNGFSITESGVYRDTLMAANGCDSFIVLTLNVLDTFQTQISETIFEGENLPFNNQNLSKQGTFRDTLSAANGCDSFIVLTLTVLDTFQTQITETICQGETLNFNNQDLSQSGVYRDTLAAVTNADSFIVLTLNVLDTFQTQISETIFEGENLPFNNQNLSEQGTFRDTLAAQNGCDSFIVLTLTVLDTFQTQITETICQGETLNFNNQNLSESGVYRDTLAAVTNADSFIVLTLNVLDTFQTQISETIFEGENLPFNNQNLSEQGTFRDTLAAQNGCDSFIVLTITVLDTFQTQITETICQGETLNFNNQDLSQSGIYRDTLAAVTNADSFIVLTLNVLDTFQTQISETIFEGENLPFNNQNLSEQGTFRDTLAAQNGCDSFIVLTITVLDTFQTQITETICQGETLNFNNQDLSQSGIYRDTLAAVTNADSFIVLTLNVLDTFQTQISETIFEGANFSFNNQNLSEQGTFRDTLAAANGCDSFIVLTLTVLDTFQTQITETICQGETLNFNNQDLSQSGVYRDTLAAVTNADSFIVLTLNVLDTFQTQISETIFEGENLPFNNQNLSEQGTFRDTLAAQNGCDSFIVLTLTVLDTFQTQITETICQGETLNFNNQNLSESGVYRDTLTAVTNADSFIVLTLNVLDTFQTQISETIFEGENLPFNNQNLSEQGTFRDTLSSANGCDSFIVLTITVLDTFQTQITETICQGETLNFNNQNLSESGVYRDTLAAVTNADSFIVLTLNVLDTFQTQISETIFEGENLPFNNQNLSEQGTFRDTLAAQNGCDSFIVLTITVLDTFQTQITETICQGETLNFNNQDLSESGIYRDTLAAVTNADSFIVLTLNVLDTFQTEISQPICNGDAFNFNGFSISESGIYRDTLMAANGCDSFIVLTINILDTFQTQISETICQGDSFNFNDASLSESGIYRDTLTAANGCDSFIVLTINILDTFQTQISETICQGDSFNFNDASLSETGIYQDTLTAANGCDSFIVLTLKVNPTPNLISTDTSICKKDALNLRQRVHGDILGKISYSFNLIDWFEDPIIRLQETTRIYARDSIIETGCVDTVSFLITIGDCEVKIEDPCACLNNETMPGNGQFSDLVTISTTFPNEQWKVIYNDGMYDKGSPEPPNAPTLIPIGTVLTSGKKDGKFYTHYLELKHIDLVGFLGLFTNGRDTLTATNVCSYKQSCNFIISINPDGTPPVFDPTCTIVNNVSPTKAESTLTDCEDCTYVSDNVNELYTDTIARNNVHTICPPITGQKLHIEFTHFDLAIGDTLFVFDGSDTLSNLVNKYTGTGVSQTGGSINASCLPGINTEGCLTFQFKTNGDNNKGTGWVAKTSCETDETILIAPKDLNAKLLCDETYEIFTIEPATVMSNCTAIQDSQLVRIYNEQQEIIIDTLIAFDEPFNDTFAIGQYFVEYKLKTDTTIATIGRISVQGPALVCNDAVLIPLGSACGIQILPDDLLENPCDTLTDSLYYYITLKGLDKNGQSIVLATGGGKGGGYPILDKTHLTACGSTITAEIERRYFDNTTLTFPNNGSKIISCETTVNLVDNSAPVFVSGTTIDTFKRCEIILTEKGLGLIPPKAVDNCDSIAVNFETATILSGFNICDTTQVSVIWSATDQCGNQSQMTQLVIFIRPSLADLVQASDVILSCGEDTKATFDDMTKTGMPSIKIGQVKNGQLIPTDTLALSTENYVCGYILQKREVELDNDCGTKLFRYWDVVDWCNSVAGPMPIDTQFIELKDTISPTITYSLSSNLTDLETINLGPKECKKVVQLELPQATDNCSEVMVAEYTVEQLVDSNWVKVANNLATIALPSDTFRVGYRAFDSCSEQVKEDSCFRYFMIEDHTLPTPICTDVINLSIPQDSAQLHYSAIDNGSYDACGIVQYEVSRDQVIWGEKVGFGCADIHQAIKVYLRVTDKNGNQNTCWMIVKPEDKIRPICSPLTDQFATCDEGRLDNFGPSTDANNNGQMDLEEWVNLSDKQIEFYNTNYGNPDCSDNVRCNSLVIEQQYQLLPKNCGQTSVKRRYRAKDWQGQGNTSNWDEQTITISYQPDWSITLPADWQGKCGDELPTPSLEIINGHCDALAYEVTEKTFTTIENACLKTVRTFTIINWCLYQPGTPVTTIQRKENSKGVVANNQTITAKDMLNNRALGTIGALQYSQVLKIQDHTAPIIKIDPVDDCISMDNCEQEKVFSISATDCNLQSSATLSYEWAVYLNNIKVDNGTGPSFTRTVSTTNNLRVAWKVTDACGNRAWANGQHYFVDCKKPTPYCLHGSAVNLMENRKVAVWAKDLDQNSGDNCSNKENLAYRIWHNSLGTAPTHIASIHALPENIEFTCSYLGNQVVRLYLIDAANNWDFCETYVNIQDNNQVCEELELEHADTLFANGKILSWTQQAVENVEMNVGSITQMTDVNGQFALPLAKGNNYTITPRKNTDPLNGVTTYDLVLISKHILGLKSFENPYQYIAADVNKSGSVTAYDLVILRRLILSIEKGFINNESWRFVATSQVIDENNPLQQDLLESIEVADLQSTMTADFTAIKIGDINGNARTNSLFVSESRQSKAIFEIKIQDQALVAGQTYEVAFTSDQLHQIQGYQFSLDFEKLTFEKLHPSLAKIEHFGLHHIQDGRLSTSWNKSVSSQLAVSSGQLAVGSEQWTTLFKMTFVAQRDGLLSEVLQLKTRPIAIESYDLNGDVMDIKLTFFEQLGQPFELYQNQPNPFDKKTEIGFYLPKASPVTLRLSSETGQLLKEIKVIKSTGYQSIDLEGLDLPKGLIFYQLQTDFGTEVKKMLRVE